MYALSASRKILAPIVIGSLLFGCGGSDVGKQEAVGPQAVVTVIGQPYVPASGTTAAAATIRSQTEVTLSAKDSINGSAPITEFSFKQTDNNAVVPLVVKTRNTVTFTAPAVAQLSPYKFTLTVKDSNGKTSSADVSFTVMSVLDQNTFLSYIGVPNTYTIEAAPTSTVVGDTGAPEGATLGTFTITIERLLTYTDRANNPAHVDVPLDVVPNTLPLKIHGSWPTRTGANAACGSSENPRFTLDIPALDADDLNVLVQSGDRTKQLELADIDAADLRLKITIAADSGGLVPGVCVSGANSFTPVIQSVSDGELKSIAAFVKPNSVGSGIVSVATLRGDPVAPSSGASAATFDSLISSIAYYKSIGEQNTKKSFFDWLRANGFDPAAANYGADAHAIYSNNFDLGFGRDMYMKIGTCTTLSVNIGSCDVASVVVNYASMEGAAKKLGPINAVAMEYSATPTSNGKRVVKFYAYAPDPRDPAGDFRRVHSVNLDGRGEKSVPASCTICHGGAPQGLTGGVYANGGDLNSAFLLWDLDTLLYSDKDPSFSAAAQDATLKANLTRDAQEAELRKLNAGAYLTMFDQVDGRFTLARELISGWYTANALPVPRLDQVLSGTHAGAFVPDGWKTVGVDKVIGTADDNPASAADVYSKVYASYCRTCHVVQVPKTNLNVHDPFSTCGAQGAAYSGGSDHQLAFGCYSQFVNAKTLLDQLRRAQMPNARLTMDRFWVNPVGESAARTLARHLVTVGKVTTTDAASPEISLAPKQTAILDAASVFDTGAERSATSVPFDATSGSMTVQRGKYIRLLGGSSILAGAYTWSVTRSGSNSSLAGATTSMPVFAAAQPGTYAVTLSVGGATTLARSVVVPDWEPVAHNDPASGILTAAPGQLLSSINVLQNDRARIKGTTTELPLSSGDGGYEGRVRLCAPTSSCSTSSKFFSSTNVELFTATVMSDGSISFIATAAAANSTQQFSYWVSDVDGDSSTATVSVNVSAALAVTANLCVPVKAGNASTAAVGLGGQISGGATPYSILINSVGLQGNISVPAGATYSSVYTTRATFADSSSAPIKQFNANDTFTFSVTDSGTPGATANGTVTLEVQAQKPWTDGGNGVKNIWSPGCTGCHDSGHLKLDLVTSDGGYGLASDPKSLFATSSSRVVPTNPPTSKLLTCPSHYSDALNTVVAAGGGTNCNDTHATANQRLTYQQYQAILTWIREGALQNDKASYSCGAPQ